MRLSTPRARARCGDGARVDHARGGVETAGDLEGHDAAVTPHLPAGDFVLGVCRQAGVVHRRDTRVAHQELGERLGIGVLAFDPKRERLQPPDQEVAAKGSSTPPIIPCMLRIPSTSSAEPRRHRRGCRCGRPGTGGGVQHEIDTELERSLVEGRRECRIDERLHPVTAADLGEPLEIEDAVVGVWSVTRST